MKVLVLVLSIISLAFALSDDPPGFLPKLNEQDLKLVVEEFGQHRGSFESLEYEDGDGKVTAIINEFVDRLLANIGILAKEKGFDPMHTNGFNDNFLLARVTLSNGTLEGMSTITRHGDVEASYQLTKHILNLKVPIKFDHIRFEYKFYVLLLLLGHSGKLNGNIDSVKVYVELSFDFNIYQAKLNKVSMIDTGHISIHVDGGIIEVVLSILSELVTTIIHPLIIGVIQAVIKGALSVAVNIVNTVINDVLHPNVTALLV